MCITFRKQVLESADFGVYNFYKLFCDANKISRQVAIDQTASKTESPGGGSHVECDAYCRDSLLFTVK